MPKSTLLHWKNTMWGGHVNKFIRYQALFFIGVLIIFVAPTSATEIDKTPSQRALLANAWADFADQIKAMGNVIQQDTVPDNPIDLAEGYRYLLGQLAEHIEVALYRSDLNDPLLRYSISKFRNTAMPSSDGHYVNAQIDDGGSYRLWGKLGTAKGNISFQFYSSVNSLAEANIRDFADADGMFDIQIGGERQSENWVPLPKGAQMIFIREYFSDWQNEHKSEFFFDRLDRVPGGEPLSPEKLVSILEAVEKSYGGQIPYWKMRMDQIRATHKNEVTPPKVMADVGLLANMYGTGWFDLKEDEALLIELEQTDAMYWSIQLGNYWGEALDYVSYIPSITGDQAYLASDGQYWVVIANKNPGVPNWLDTEHHPEGMIFTRFQGVKEGPAYRVHHIKLNELQKLLPADTPKISNEQHNAELRRRQDHMVKRWAP